MEAFLGKSVRTKMALKFNFTWSPRPKKIIFDLFIFTGVRPTLFYLGYLTIISQLTHLSLLVSRLDINNI